MDLLNKFHDFIAREQLFHKNDRLLIAVSGGIDSIVLCELCHQSHYNFAIAHCNFRLRGEDSDADESFVKNMGVRYGVEVFTIQFDTLDYASVHNKNIQSAARMLRYEWFNKLLQQETTAPFKYILTAHHANDQSETVLMNFFKGTGIKGLLGMQPRESGIGGKITRPLLFAKKEDIRSFALTANLPWREDVSNDSNKYSRNFIRNEVLPLLEKNYPRLTDNILNNAERFTEVYNIYNASIENIKKKLVLQKGEDYHIPVLKLLQHKQVSTIVYEIFHSFGFSSHQIPEIIKLCNAESGKYVSTSSYRVIKNRQWLILSKLHDIHSNIIIVEKDECLVAFNNLQLEISSKTSPFSVSIDNNKALLDADDIKFPLIIRRWKMGDYFYPLGMNKKKKLSRFFIDIKLSTIEKEQTWVVESDKKILWVVGQRIDNRFRLTPQSKTALQLIVSSPK